MTPTLFQRRQQHAQAGEDIVMEYLLLSFTAFYDVVGVGSASAVMVMVKVIAIYGDGDHCDSCDW